MGLGLERLASLFEPAAVDAGDSPRAYDREPGRADWFPESSVTSGWLRPPCAMNIAQSDVVHVSDCELDLTLKGQELVESLE